MSGAATAVPAGLAPASVRDVLKNRPFLFLWLAQLLSQTAQNAIFLVLLYVIEQQYQSSFLAAVMVVTFLIPTIVLGIGAGVLVDHVDKKIVLVVTNALRAGVTLLFIVFGGFLPLLFLVNFVFSCISQFFAPAEAASIPVLVKKRELIAANGLFNVTISFAQLLGFVVFGPALFAQLGADRTFIAIAVTFGVCAALCMLLPREGKPATPLTDEERRSLVTGTIAEIRDGFRVLRGERRISLAMVHLAMANSLILVLATIAPGFVSRVVQVSVDNAIVLLAPAFLGIVGATLTMPQLARRFSKHTLIRIGIGLMAGGLGLLGAIKYARDGVQRSSELAGSPLAFLGTTDGIQSVILVFAVILGLGYGMINIPAQTVVMESTPQDFRGRIFAVQLTFTNVIAVFPLLFAASLADLLGIEVVLFGLAAVVAAVYVFTILQERRLTPLVPAPLAGGAPVE